MACLNINSLVSHIDDLRIFMSQSKGIDILAINETKLDSAIKVNEVHIPGYDIVRKDRENNGDMVVVSVFTFEVISIFKSVLTSAREILNALLLRSRDPDQSRSLCLLGTDRHSHLLTFSRSLRGLLTKLTLKIWNYIYWVT